MSVMRRSLGLSRRVVVFYLLFCLLTIGWLAAGSLFVAHRVLGTRTETYCLSQLSKVSAALSLADRRSGSAALQTAVERTAAEGGFSYGALLSSTGQYLAHTRRSLVGKPAVEPTGQVVEWGNVKRVRYVDEAGQFLREYRSPVNLKAGPGMLVLGDAEPSSWQTVAAIGDVFALAVLAPLVCIGLGALALFRMLQPLASIDAQLRQLAAADSVGQFALQPVTVRSAAAQGWNRLIHDRLATRPASDLGTRLSQALEARAQGRIEDALHSLSDGLAVTDPEGKLAFANRAITALLALDETPAELVGRQFDEVLQPHADQLAQSPLFDAQAAERTVVTEITENHGGGKRVLRLARQPVRCGGDRRRHIWSVRDVTQQKLIDQARDQFLDSATHELRTPLATIRAYAETLALSEMVDVEKQKEFCNTINSEATRLARFIDDLLSLSAIEVGSLSISPTNVAVERLLQEVVGKARTLMEHNGLTFDVVLPEKLPEMRLDKDKVATTLVNLLSNAAKYTPVGGRVVLKATLTAEALEIAVEDNGYGIAADELDKVFEKFHRSSDQRVRSKAGSGLGLPLAREVARLHGGDIALRSELNKGSTFTLTLPMR